MSVWKGSENLLRVITSAVVRTHLELSQTTFRNLLAGDGRIEKQLRPYKRLSNSYETYKGALAASHSSTTLTEVFRAFPQF
jgi:hypothetical protein